MAQCGPQAHAQPQCLRETGQCPGRLGAQDGGLFSFSGGGESLCWGTIAVTTKKPECSACEQAAGPSLCGHVLCFP